jgi:hypothetical protein
MIRIRSRGKETIEAMMSCGVVLALARSLQKMVGTGERSLLFS